MRILVADDNQNAAHSLAEFLTVMGHEVQVAYDGGTALSVARSFKPLMAFLDIEMPILDGFQVARQIRADDRSIVLTAVTGLADENEERAHRAGFDHFLTKPVELTRLERLVDDKSASAEN